MLSKLLYSKVVHNNVLCTNGMYRIADESQEKFLKLDIIVAKIKKIFFKALNRIIISKNKLSG